jgi:hypothetical protein
MYAEKFESGAGIARSPVSSLKLGERFSLPSSIAQPPLRTSEVLCEFARSRTAERVTVGEIVEALGDRGIGVVIAIFAIPNTLPSTVPFGNVLTGIPVILFAAQLMFGMERLYLPGFIARRSIDTAFFKSWTPRVGRLLAWFERLLRPRLLVMTTSNAERAIGILCVLLSIVSTLPIPFGHQLPALGIMLIGLGLIERDGLALLIGSLIGIVGMTLLGLALFGLYHGAQHLMHNHAMRHWLHLH